MLCFIALHRFCMFYKLKVVATLHWARLSASFSQKNLFTSCLWATFLQCSECFKLYYFFMIIFLWQSVIKDHSFNHWNCFVVPWAIVLEDSKLKPHVLCVFWLLHWWAGPLTLPLSLGLPVPWETRNSNAEMKPVHNLTMASKCSVKGRIAHLSLKSRARNE